MTKKLLYATTNPGKLQDVRSYYGLSVVSPKDIGMEIHVEETGKTLEENAFLKALAYLRKTTKYVVMADDTGLEIDALRGEPGVHVRRWKDGKTRMSDKEIIEYALFRMKGIPRGKRDAQFRAVYAVGSTIDSVRLFDGVIRGEILDEYPEKHIEGYPFEFLFFVPDWGMKLGDMHSVVKPNPTKYASHRGRALAKARPYIEMLLREKRKNH